jgi:hypothetical protein
MASVMPRPGSVQFQAALRGNRYYRTNKAISVLTKEKEAVKGVKPVR